MSTKIAAPKGCLDILPDESGKWQTVERIAREVAEIYHFREIRTPIFEHTELFHRGVGEASEIVHKETYTFLDRGERSLTLRPEGTAGVVRAMIEHGCLNDEGSRAKVFYIGPNFRYERPQSGRLRQHFQFGVEAFGIAAPEQDVECILLQRDFYKRCGVRGVKLRINSLGDRESKQRFAEHIHNSLIDKKSQLSEDSQRRLDDNPLRILDSKDPRDRDLTSNLFGSGFLSEVSRQHLDRVQSLLKDAGVDDCHFDGQLVRGFDYYTGTLWEFTADGLGAQNAIGGGGRYDNLVEALGGRPTPGVGFGSGLERLLIALEAQGVQLVQEHRPLVYLIAQNDAAREANLGLLRELRAAGFAADMDPTGRSMKSQFKLADREKAAVVLVVGESELAANTVAMKDLVTGQQQTVARNDLINHLTRAFATAISPQSGAKEN